MMSGHWSLSDIPWQDFDPAKVDPELLKIIKAASLVEFNGRDYADYLCNVFPDDQAFRAAAKIWADEEVQHGEALGRWAEMADPDFDFKASVERFRDGYQIPVEAEHSVRGSRSGELVARCIVEVGTSSFYASISSMTDEPVLKEVCDRIAADELRHYKLFYTHLKRYLKQERIGRLRRVAVALGRIGESEDDELAYAYFAANGDGSSYDHKRHSQAYLNRVYACYRPIHVQRAVSMIFKAAGLNPQGRLSSLVSRLAFAVLRWRSRRAVTA